MRSLSWYVEKFLELEKSDEQEKKNIHFKIVG